MLSCSRGKAPATLPNDIPAALEQAGADVIRDESKQSKPVTAIHFKETTVNENTLALLKRIPTLTTLSLRACQVTNAGLKEVAAIPSLQNLFLVDCTWLTDDDVKELEPLRNLRELVLTGCEKISDAGLKSVASLKSLRLLELAECKQISDIGLNELKSLKNLRRLGLSNCVRVSDAGVKDLNMALPQCIVTRDQYDLSRTGVR
jgi:hypothetical protein